MCRTSISTRLSACLSGHRSNDLIEIDLIEIADGTKSVIPEGSGDVSRLSSMRVSFPAPRVHRVARLVGFAQTGLSEMTIKDTAGAFVLYPWPIAARRGL
jgi:hypothetical protein